jgi:hypothetical protein
MRWWLLYPVWHMAKSRHFREVSCDLFMFTMTARARVCVLDCRCRSVVVIYIKDVNDGSIYTDSPSFPCTRPVKLQAGFGSNAKSSLTYWATTFISCHISSSYLMCEFCNVWNALTYLMYLYLILGDLLGVLCIQIISSRVWQCI